MLKCGVLHFGGHAANCPHVALSQHLLSFLYSITENNIATLRLGSLGELERCPSGAEPGRLAHSDAFYA